MNASSPDAGQTGITGGADQAFYNSHLGPYLCGLTFQVFMMGVFTLQTWNYYELFPKDPRWLKAYVALLFVMGATQSGIYFSMLYTEFVSHYGRIDAWNSYSWRFFLEVGWTVTISSLAQAFFLQRCYQVTKSRIILFIGSCGVLSAFGVGWAAANNVRARRFFATMASKHVCRFPSRGTAWLILAALTDLFISVILIIYLRRMTSAFKSTKRILRQMIWLAFETAALTSLVAIANAVTYLVYGSENTVHMFFQFIVGKMYTHSVMVTLLARRRVWREGTTTITGQGFESMAHKPTTHPQSHRFTRTMTMNSISKAPLPVDIFTPEPTYSPRRHRRLRDCRANYLEDGIGETFRRDNDEDLEAGFVFPRRQRTGSSTSPPRLRLSGLPGSLQLDSSAESHSPAEDDLEDIKGIEEIAIPTPPPRSESDESDRSGEGEKYDLESGVKYPRTRVHPSVM